MNSYSGNYSGGYDKNGLIEAIDICHTRNGKVNGEILNSEDDLPCRKTFYKKFGSVDKAIKEAGYTPYRSQEKEKVTVVCGSCGAEDDVYPYRAKEFENGIKKNCGRCMVKKKEVECTTCSKTIERHRYQIEEGWSFFCSEDCQSSWQSERFSGVNHPRWNEDKKDYRYGPSWPEKREERIEKDGFECTSCGMSREAHYAEFGRDIHVHHEKRLGDFIETEGLCREQAHQMENLKTLCIVCHRKEEADE